MKVVVSLVVVFVMALGARAASEGQSPAPRTISVTGTAVGYIPADTILWDVTLQSAGKDLVEAKAANEQLVKGLVDACGKKGILPADIVAGFIRAQDARVAENTGVLDVARAFTVTRTVTVRQRDPRQFSDLFDMLSHAKGVKVRYSVVSSKTDQVTKETLVKATQAAKDKATAMTAVLGARVGNVLSINEYPPAGWHVPDANVTVDESSTAFGVDAEKVCITVYVTFEIL